MKKYCLSVVFTIMAFANPVFVAAQAFSNQSGRAVAQTAQNGPVSHTGAFIVIILLCFILYAAIAAIFSIVKKYSTIKLILGGWIVMVIVAAIAACLIWLATKGTINTINGERSSLGLSVLIGFLIGWAYSNMILVEIETIGGSSVGKTINDYMQNSNQTHFVKLITALIIAIFGFAATKIYKWAKLNAPQNKTTGPPLIARSSLPPANTSSARMPLNARKPANVNTLPANTGLNAAKEEAKQMPESYMCAFCKQENRSTDAQPAPCICCHCQAENHKFEWRDNIREYRDYEVGSRWRECVRCGQKKDYESVNTM